MTTTMSPAKASTEQFRRKKRDVNGIILLDKPIGITSNRALQQVKHLYQASKAGHTGSLDPLATGMLPLCFGQATKVSSWLLDSDKTYEVEILIGSRTDTADADGQVVETNVRSSVSEQELREACSGFFGEMDQVPPMYSALKKDGKRLYELAREGKNVERAPRCVTIHELSLIKFDSQRPQLRVSCSKGTYVRTLMEDLAAAMDTLAHVTALRRIAITPFGEAPMISMAHLEAADEAGLDELLIAPDKALTSFAAVTLSSTEAHYLRHGHAVGHVSSTVSGLVRVYDDTGLFLGVGAVQLDGTIAPKRLFVAAN
jgi:tRNA pseudouridine55 synthase